MSGNLWMFSDMLDDEDIEMRNTILSRYIKVPIIMGLG